MKNLISTLFIGGALVLGGCGENKDSKVEEKSELEKYNLENKQLHKDFIKFCNENPNKKEYAQSQYEIKFPNKGYSIDFNEDGFLFITLADTNFQDVDADGLDNKFQDSYTFEDKNTGLIDHKYLKDLSPKEKLSIAKQYTNLKRKILHDGKYKNY